MPVNEVIELEALAGKISAGSGRTVTAIAGPPGAGKSTLAESLANALNKRSGCSAAVFPMDGYHFDDCVLEERGQRLRKGAPFTFDVAGFGHMLKRLKANEEEEIAVPVFDRSIEIARAGARIIRSEVQHIIAEGNYLLLNQEPWLALAPLFDHTVWIGVGRDELERRLIDRWQSLDPDRRRAKIYENDLPNVDFVQSNSRGADFLIRQG